MNAERRRALLDEIRARAVSVWPPSEPCLLNAVNALILTIEGRGLLEGLPVAAVDAMLMMWRIGRDHGAAETHRIEVTA